MGHIYILSNVQYTLKPNHTAIMMDRTESS